MKNNTNKWLYLTIFSLLLFVSSVLIVSFYVYKVHIEALKNEYYSELQSISRMKFTTYYNWRSQHVSNAYYLQNVYPFISNIKSLLNNKKGFVLDKSSKETFTLLTKGARYRSIVLIDSTNKEYLLAGKPLLLSDSSKRIIKRSFNRKGVYFSDFQFEEGLKNPYVIISCSLTHGLGKNSKTFAVLVFSINLRQGLLQLLNSTKKGEQQFETVFALPKQKSDGPSYQLKFSNENSHIFEIAVSNIPYVDYRNLKVNFGDYEGPDYQGRPIMAKIRKGISSDWLLITKLDLSSFNIYKKNFALAIIVFDLLFLMIASLSIYLALRYSKILLIKDAYNILIEKQAFQIRYEALLKNANDAIILFDNKKQVVEVNDVAISIYGYDRKEIVKLKMADIWKEEKYKEINNNLKNINLINGYVFESEHIKKDGTVFSAEISARQIEIEGNTYYQTIIRDITDRKIAEQRLFKSKEQYKELVENINDVIFTVQESGIISYISPVIENILGYTPNEMIGKNFTEFICKADMDRFLINSKELFSKEIKTNYLTLIKKSGEICHVKTSTRTVLNHVGEFIITGSLTDLTQEKKLEQLLNKEREDLRTIINLSPVAIYFKDKQNNYIRVNKAAALTANSTVEELEGKSAKDFYPNGFDKYQKDDFEVIFTGKPKFGIIETLHLAEKTISLRSDKVPWYNEHGEIAGIICFSVDITEQIKAEEELRKEKNLLQWILSTIPVGLLYLNKDGEIIFGNLAAESIFGIKLNEEKTLLSELKINDYDGNIISDENKPFSIVKSRNLPVKGILQSFIKNDARILLSVNISPLISNIDEFEGAVASIEDITLTKEAEEKLIQNEKRYRSLFEGMQEGFAFHQIICNPDGIPIDYRFLEVNPAFERLTGLKSSAIIGKTAKEILPKLEPYWVEEYGRVALGGDYKEFDNYSAEIGKYFRVSVFSNQKEYFAVIFEDITERKKIENALIESEKRFRQVAENTNDWIWEVDENGVFRFSSSSVEKILGYNADELIGKKHFYDLFTNETMEDFNKMSATDIFEKKYIQKWNNANLNIDGSIVVLEKTSSPIFDNAGNFMGYIGADTDVTEQVKRQKEIIDLKNKFSKAFYTSPDAINIVRLKDNCYVDINNGFTKMMGYTEENVLGKSTEEINVWGVKEEKINFETELQKKGIVQNREGEFKRKDGSLVVGLISAVVIEVNEEKCVLTITRDITDRKKIENELQIYRENLEKLVKIRTQELNKTNALLKEEIEKGKGIELMLQQSLDQVQKFSDLKSRFISTASHEFRTPLATMFSSTELLEAYGRKWNIEKYMEHISRIKNSIGNLTYLIDDVLSVSKVEAGKIEYEPREFDFEDFCVNLVKEFQNELAKSHIINLAFKSAKKYFFLDERLFRSILLNLLSNAVKYSKVGETVVLNVLSNDVNIIIEIIDNGIGIAPEDINYLFEPFHRGANVNQIPGTGLGMSIVKRYVELHEGEILVDSKVNFGTKIILIIPIKKKN
ncbi:MAG: PAS domain S-box protein [bacterium]